MCYEEFNENFEYLDLSRRNLGIKGIIEILDDIAEDRIIKQLDLSYNITADEMLNPRNVEYLLKNIKRTLSKNKTLRALDFAGNHLFDHKPHPTNEHIKLYAKEFTDVLLATSVTHIDVSENNIIGNASRELKGLLIMMQKFMINGNAFKCRFSKLNSQGFKVVSNCLGVFSSMTYLDLSDNYGGLDPMNRSNSEGIIAIANLLSQTLHMKVLKLARNHLKDEDVEIISESLQAMPTFQDLDISGNLCHYTGTKGVKMAIISHSLLEGSAHQGFRDLDISNNPIGDDGIQELSICIAKTQTLKSLNVSNCNIKDHGMMMLQKGLMENNSVINLNIHNNLINKVTDAKTMAEIEATRLTYTLQQDPLSIDASKLTKVVYTALARKLRFIPNASLAILHGNPSFNIPLSVMKESLHLLEPPPRQQIIEQVRMDDPALVARLKKSAEINHKLDASRKIFNAVMNWYKDIRIRNRLNAAIAEAKRREEERNARNDDDDKYKY